MDCLLLCRGQGYDGAGNMADRISGTASRIQQMFKSAVYVHCNSHLLNLCIAASCQIQIVKNVMNKVRALWDFFNNSPKRSQLLTGKIRELLPDALYTHLIDVCGIRWVARIYGLGITAELYPAIIASLNVIRQNVDGTWNYESTQKAVNIYHYIVTFQFVNTLVIVSRCLEVTRPLTKQLQTASYDPGTARNKVSLLYVMLEKMRCSVDEKHKLWFEEAVAITNSTESVPEKPRTASKQIYRDDTPSNSSSEYFRRTISVPFLDNSIGHINSRFASSNLDVMDALYGMPCHVLSNLDWQTGFRGLLQKYKDDLPEPRFLSTELDMWGEYCLRIDGALPTTMQELLLAIDRFSFPNMVTASN